MKPQQQFHQHHSDLIETFKSLRNSALKSPDDHGRELCQFLHDNIKPHAEATQEILYGLIDDAAGSPMATKTMRLEHQRLVNLIDHLDDSIDDTNLFRQDVQSFSTLLLNHFSKEEEVLIPFIVSERSESALEEILREIQEVEESTTP